MADGGGSVRGGGDVSDALHRLALGLVDHAQVRLQLLQQEFSLELDRLGGLFWRALLAGFLALLTIEFTGVAILAAVWDTPYRVPTAVGLVVASALATGVALASWKKQKREASKLFTASLNELSKDRAALKSLAT